MRSYLFAPATDERLVPKALASDADVVVLDLEDSVAPGAQGTGHDVLRQNRQQIIDRPTHLRVGWESGSYAAGDVELAIELGVTALRLPKAEEPDQIRTVLEVLGEAATVRIHPTVESALGLSRVADIAACSSHIERFVFGERDFMADVGVDEPGPLTTHARADLALKSRAARLLQPIDGAYIHIDDPDGLRQSAERARSLGFWGKSALHPAQLPVIHDVFSHSPERIAWAERVTDAHAAALTSGRSVLVLDGTFIDAAIVRRAAEILKGVPR